MALILTMLTTATWAMALAMTGPVAAQDLSERLEAEHLGAIQTGTYEAGDITFMLDRDQGHYLLRFAGEPEIFVLYTDNASLGGRVLKYDSGKTVLTVTGWGGMTLYTDAHPAGLPVMRNGDSTLPPPAPVSLETLQAAVLATSQMLAAQHHLSLDFELRAQHLADDGAIRIEGLEALENTARGIERFCATPAGVKAIAGHLHMVLVKANGKPALERRNGALIVTFNPADGYAGRASSRAVDHALQVIFQTP